MAGQYNDSDFVVFLKDNEQFIFNLFAVHYPFSLPEVRKYIPLLPIGDRYEKEYNWYSCYWEYWSGLIFNHKLFWSSKLRRYLRDYQSERTFIDLDPDDTPELRKLVRREQYKLMDGAPYSKSDIIDSLSIAAAYEIGMKESGSIRKYRNGEMEATIANEKFKLYNSYSYIFHPHYYESLDALFQDILKYGDLLALNESVYRYIIRELEDIFEKEVSFMDFLRIANIKI
jgi:hypothetical protein